MKNLKKFIHGNTDSVISTSDFALIGKSEIINGLPLNKGKGVVASPSKKLNMYSDYNKSKVERTQTVSTESILLSPLSLAKAIKGRAIRDPLHSNKPYKNIIKGLVGHPYNSATLMHYSSKEIVYSFNKANLTYPILTKIENLLKSFFLSMYSLISRPIYLIKHDKIIIQLFVFLSPKADKFLDTTTFVKDGKLRGPSKTIFRSITKKESYELSMKNYLRLKSLR